MYDYSSLIDLDHIPHTDSNQEEHQKQSRPQRSSLKLLITKDDRKAGSRRSLGFLSRPVEVEPVDVLRVGPKGGVTTQASGVQEEQLRWVGHPE